MEGAPHHAEAMSRKRQAMLWLVVAVSLVLYLLWRKTFGGWGIAIAWAALLGGAYAGNRILLCPACGRRLGGLYDKVCGRCGAVLTDEPVMRPSKEGPADPRAVEYVEQCRLILRWWGLVRPWLGKAVYAVGALTGVVASVMFWRHDHRAGEAAVLGLILCLVAAAATWLVLVYAFDELFGICFLLLCGRCPVCHAWFTPPSSFGLGTLSIDTSLPDYCDSCGAKLR